jgi:hypothetical protein
MLFRISGSTVQNVFSHSVQRVKEAVQEESAKLLAGSSCTDETYSLRYAPAKVTFTIASVTMTNTTKQGPA